MIPLESRSLAVAIGPCGFERGTAILRGTELADIRAFKRNNADLTGNESAPETFTVTAEYSSFEDIFYRFGKPVMSFICNMIADRALAEELTQETFVRAFRQIGSRQTEGKVSTWLFGIAHNVVREAVRQKYRGSRSVAIDIPAVERLRDSQPPADNRLIARELVRRVQDAMDALPEDHRAAFVLKMIYRLPYEEISTITGASIGKLKTDLHRARAEMRRRLKPYLGEHFFRVRG